MGVENGRALAYLAAHGEILSKQYRESRVLVHCRIPQYYYGRMERDGITVQLRTNGQAMEEVA